MTPQELESCVLAGLLNGGASPDAFDVIASTPEESFSIVSSSRVLRNQKTGADERLIDMLFVRLWRSSLADLSEFRVCPPRYQT
jgi:replicative DNA helicase